MADHVQGDLRLAGHVQRYHTWPHLRAQSVGEHTFQLLRLVLQVYPAISKEALVYIVTHDMGEIKTGDLPYPIKKDNPVLQQECDRLEVEALADLCGEWSGLCGNVMPYEKHVIKTCEMLEMLEYGMTEYLMGNRLASPIVERTGAALIELSRKLDASERYELQRVLVKRMTLWDAACTSAQQAEHTIYNVVRGI